jgi:hypothetical protein
MSSIFWYACANNHNHDFYTIHPLHFIIIYCGDGKGPGAITPAYTHIQARSLPKKGRKVSCDTHCT